MYSQIEIEATRDRIRWMRSLVAQLRERAAADEFPLVAGAYLSEIAKMQNALELATGFSRWTVSERNWL